MFKAQYHQPNVYRYRNSGNTWQEVYTRASSFIISISIDRSLVEKFCHKEQWQLRRGWWCHTRCYHCLLREGEAQWVWTSNYDQELYIHGRQVYMVLQAQESQISNSASTSSRKTAIERVCIYRFRIVHGQQDLLGQRTVPLNGRRLQKDPHWKSLHELAHARNCQAEQPQERAGGQKQKEQVFEELTRQGE